MVEKVRVNNDSITTSSQIFNEKEDTCFKRALQYTCINPWYPQELPQD